jgi:DNA-binding NtrC family response regulator
MARILIVEDEPHMAKTLEFLLHDRHELIFATDGRQAIDHARRTDLDAAILDINLPDMDGLQVLRELRQLRPETQPLMITARKDVKTAVEAMKLGASDYLQKPFEEEELLMAVDRALEKRCLVKQVSFLYEEVRSPFGFDKILTQCPAMQELLQSAQRAASADQTVLISGETGTGKEILARAIHFAGPRARRPFVAFNCARYTETLIESELFGHEEGAFTGATRTHRGKFEQAHGGTLFLDEIGLMPPATQARLLRVLEDRRVERVGGEGSFQVDVRVVAATNADLEELVSRGAFRSDLYYRLKVIPLSLPPLRERAGDIPLLADHFLRARGAGKKFDSEALRLLSAYDWPGNVRELQNLIEALVVTTDARVLDSASVAKHLFSRVARSPQDLLAIPPGPDYERRMSTFEKDLILDALRRHGWNRTRAAQELGWHRNTLLHKMRRLEIADTHPDTSE